MFYTNVWSQPLNLLQDRVHVLSLAGSLVSWAEHHAAVNSVVLLLCLENGMHMCLCPQVQRFKKTLCVSG